MLRRLSFQLSYYRRPPWDTGISPPELIQFIRDHAPGRAIDIGCGTGTNVITLALAGWKVTGVDYAPRAVHLAKKKIKAAKMQAEVSVSDATRLDGIRGPFDLALDIGCFHNLTMEHQGKYLEQLERILAPGGFWLMYGSLRSEADDASFGLSEAEISRISSRLALLSRQDGVDDQRHWSSAWFLFQKATSPTQPG